MRVTSLRTLYHEAANGRWPPPGRWGMPGRGAFGGTGKGVSELRGWLSRPLSILQP